MSTFLAFAFYFDNKPLVLWNVYKTLIENSLRQCGLPYLKILGKYPNVSNNTEEYTLVSKNLNIEEIRNSYIFLFGSMNPSELTQEVQSRLICFGNSFIVPFQDQYFPDLQVSTIFIKFTSPSSILRDTQLIIDIQEIDTEDMVIDEEPKGMERTKVSKTSNRMFSKEKFKMKEAKDIFKGLYESCSEKLRKCNDSVLKLNEYNTSLTKKHEETLSKLKSLSSQLPDLDSKDPKQIRKGIENLKDMIFFAEFVLDSVEEDLAKEREKEISETNIMEKEDNYSKAREFKIKKREESIITKRKEDLEKEENADESTCPCKNKEPVPCENKLHFKRQWLIFHPDKNLGCPTIASEKFIKLQELCEHLREEEQSRTNFGKTVSKNKFIKLYTKRGNTKAKAKAKYNTILNFLKKYGNL